MAQYPKPGADQASQQDWLVFGNWKKMNTQASRVGLPDDQLAWAENLQPLAENKWQAVPAAASIPFQVILENMVLAFYATINGQDYAICFSTAGGGWFINFTTGTQGQFAPDGTFSNAPDCTGYQGTRILINDSQAGYCTWDGTVFVQQGSLSPNFVITSPGQFYGTPPTFTVIDIASNPTGTTATGTTTVVNGQVASVQLTSPGTNWTVDSIPHAVFTGGSGSGAVFSVHMTTSSLASVALGGGFVPQSTVNIHGTTGYNLLISGGGGSGASASANLQQWGGNPGLYFVSSVTITGAGSGYTSIPTITWDNATYPALGGSIPKFTANMNPIAVSSVSVVNGGTGYPPSSNIPMIFTGGSPAVPASATANVGGSGVISSVSVLGGGTYPIGNFPTADVSSGSGAAASTIVWPFVPKGTTLAVFQGRVFLGGGNLLQWTGTGASRNPGVTYDDFDSANASGSLQIVDPDLVHQISALRALNNYLWIVGDQSVKQIGNLSISSTTPPITLFTILTLSSDQGTIWPKSCISFNRIFLFANPNGIFGVFGSTVQKISDDLDGVFQNANFAQQPQGALVDLNSKHNAVFLLRYVDPIAGTRSLLLMFDGQKWWLANQGSSLVTIITYPQLVSDLNTLFGSLTHQDLTQLFADPTTAVPFKLVTALSAGQDPVQGKRIIRGGFTADAGGVGSINAEMDYDAGANAPNVFGVTGTSLLVGGANDASNNPVGGAGVYLGATLTGTMKNLVLQNVILEYQRTALWKGA